MGWDSTVAIERLWGEGAILSIRDLGILIKNGNEGATKHMEGYVKRLVGVLQKSTCLRTLRIKWENNFLVDSFPIWLEQKRLEAYLFTNDRFLRYSGSRRESDMTDDGVSIWEGKQQDILKPFKSLRSITKVSIEGAVTEEMAKDLKATIQWKKSS